MRPRNALAAAALALSLCLAAAPGSPGRAAVGPTVVASIPPIHSLVAAVMGGAGEPTLLLRGSASPHTASLRPSDATTLQRAELIFWVDDAMETFLIKPMAALSAEARVVPLARAPGVKLLASREGGVWGSHEHEHEHDRDHDQGTSGHGDDETHEAGHGAYDMHIWLDPKNAMAMADAIAAALAEVDPEHATTYQANLATLRAKIEALDADLGGLLAPVAEKPYVVFHDAYHYLEARYGLSPVGAITINPDRAPGARTLSEIRDRIERSGAVCVFREPQFEPALMRTVTAGTPARVAVLDPLGADIPPGAEAYFATMRRLATALHDCLAG